MDPGGSSGRQPSDGEDGRPFKKAKYAWQIKGRRTANGQANSSDQGRTRGFPNRTKNEGSAELSGQVTIDQVERAAPASPAHCMVVQCMEQFLSTLTRTNYVLRKWQTKQIGRGIIDNAINKVLEEMGFTPVPADPLDPNPGDVTRQNIENEGVSEAIRQQGLQRRPQAPWTPGEVLALGDSVPCTCWLYWKGNRGTLQPPQAQLSAPGSLEDKRKIAACVDEPSEEPPEDLLDAAVSFAISAKGLNIFSNPE